MRPASETDRHQPAVSTMDFDLHGIVRLRLVDPGAAQVEAMTRRLGLPTSLADVEPDVVLKFSDDLKPGPLRYLGLHSAGYNDKGFFLLDGQTGEANARIPFHQIGDRCEIACRRGLAGSIPLLFDIIRLTFLAKQYVPVHASAFVYNGIGTLVMGWAKGGKTETLLSFASEGATYVGDEWVVVSRDGETMFGLPVRVAIWDWQLEYLPDLAPTVGLQRRAVFAAVRLIDAFYKTLMRGRLRESFLAEALGQALPFLRKGLRIRELPAVVFSDRVSKTEVTIDRLCLAVSHSKPQIEIEPCDGLDIALRMASCNEYEQTDFFKYYKAFQFAFPNQRNEFLETVQDLQKKLLIGAFAKQEACRVLHPYPVSFAELFVALKTLLGETTSNSARFAGEMREKPRVLGVR